jgi:hypothetical protein
MEETIFTQKRNVVCVNSCFYLGAVTNSVVYDKLDRVSIQIHLLIACVEANYVVIFISKVIYLILDILPKPCDTWYIHAITLQRSHGLLRFSTFFFIRFSSLRAT